jgi:NADH-quinone oxidoreductase subunit J
MVILFSLFCLMFIFTVIQESTFIMIFSLISVFLLASGCLIYCSFEFLGYLLLIVYVGAVAVLFVFMVILFDKSEYQIFFEQKTIKENRILIFISVYFSSIFIVLLLGLNFILDYPFFFNYIDEFNFLYSNFIYNYLFPDQNPIDLSTISDIHSIGLVLYTDYFFSFILSGLGLLIAMIGSILITRNYYTRVDDKSKRKIQKAENQIARIATSKLYKK